MQTYIHNFILLTDVVFILFLNQTKKRYVGFMYESPDQAQPVYEAKGIETVRRDGCPAVAKVSILSYITLIWLKYGLDCPFNVCLLLNRCLKSP